MSLDRLGHDALGAAVAVHLGRVDVGQPELQAETKRSDLLSLRSAALTHVPGALPDDGYRHAGGPEEARDHRGLQ